MSPAYPSSSGGLTPDDIRIIAMAKRVGMDPKIVSQMISKMSSPPPPVPQFSASAPPISWQSQYGTALPNGLIGTLTNNNIEMIIKVGDRVKFKSSYGDIKTGWEGVVKQLDRRTNRCAIELDKEFDDGHDCNGVCRDDHGWFLDFREIEHYIKVIPPKVVKPKEFKLEHLDALVIAHEAREEIEAVLKQHKNSNKLFAEWGLGETIEYGKGMIFMFYGSPGTGKTHGAHCIAKVVEQELMVLSAAEIQSQEPGAANRNIQQAFKTAKDEGKVLFLDECDSLITARNDVGMVIGSEINTLLTEIEKFEGICILATNRIDTLDEALERRISLIIEFPEPNFEQREMIWGKLLPKKMPLEPEVSTKKLAEYKLTGGQIKNAVLQAARLALSSEAKKVSLAHFESAIARIQKSKNLMGTASRYRQGIIREDFGKRVARDIVRSDDKEPEITTDKS